MDQPRNIGQVLRKVAFKLFRVAVILSLVEGLSISMSAQILTREHRNNDLFVIVVGGIFTVRLQVFGKHLHMRQLLKNFQTTLRDASSARNTEDHGGHALGQTTLLDVLGDSGEGLAHSFVVLIHV